MTKTAIIFLVMFVATIFVSSVPVLASEFDNDSQYDDIYENGVSTLEKNIKNVTKTAIYSTVAVVTVLLSWPFPIMDNIIVL